MATMQVLDWNEPRRAATAHGGGSTGRKARDSATLARVIEGEIIPRLLVAHREAPVLTLVRAEPAPSVQTADVDRLAPMVLALDTFALLRHVEGFLARGVSVRDVFVELLAPVARRLGEYWDADTCDFIDVTMGLWRLQEIVREIGERAPGMPTGGAGRSALFAPVPGEEHSFGAVMVEELFRRAGWATDAMLDGDGAALTSRVREQAFDLLGLTIGVADRLDAVPSTIAALRAAASNSAMIVMIGGAAICGDAAIARALGADGTAPNAAEAVSQAERLIAGVHGRSATV